MERHELEALARGFQPAVVVLAANHLGVLAKLAAAPATSGEVAEALSLDRRATSVLCDALVSLGVLRRRGDALEMPQALRGLLDPASPDTMAHIFEHQWHLTARWVLLDQVVRSGEPAPRGPRSEEQLRAFILGMADIARRVAPKLWEAAPLDGATHLVDVGGGPGELSLAALERFPHLRATVFDLPAVGPLALGYAERRGVAGRFSFVEGDALTREIPACDAALVSSLVHSYGPGDTAAIARHVAAGVVPGGTVVIREFLWDDETRSAPASAGLFAVNMLIGTPAGRCWTAAELEAVFGAAGFGSWRVVRLDPANTLVIGTREG